MGVIVFVLVIEVVWLGFKVARLERELDALKFRRRVGRKF